MKVFWIRTLAVAIGLLVASGAYPQSLRNQLTDTLARNGKIIYIDGKPHDAERLRHEIDSVQTLMTHFYYDQFRNSQEPGVPFFMFLSKEANMAMGLGGVVRMRAWYDWDGAMMQSAFMPSAIPMNPSPAQMRNFDSTPAGTCLYFRVMGHNKVIGPYQLYIEAGFDGYSSRDLKLKKAYAIVRDFTVGYAPSTFSDPAALPPTVDAAGPNNKLSDTQVLVRWMPTVKDRWVFAASVETPSHGIDYDNNLTGAGSNKMPDFGVFVQYQWGEHLNQHIRLSGIYRNLSYLDKVAEKGRSTGGWGLQLSSVANPHPAVTTYLNWCYGHGYASLCGDMRIGNYDLITNPEVPGRMYAPALLGGNVGLQYNFRPNLFASIMGSMSRYLPDKAIDSGHYKYGILGTVNVFWNPIPRIQVGIEYDIARRGNFDGTHRRAQRLGAMCQFSF